MGEITSREPGDETAAYRHGQAASRALRRPATPL